MGKLNSYAVVFGSSLAWSSVVVIGGTLVESEGLFTTLTLGLLAGAALMLPAGLARVKDLMNEELLSSGVLLGLLMGALGLGSLLSALQYISPFWVLGAALCTPLFSAVFNRSETSGGKAVAIMLGYLGLVAMTAGTELLASRIGGWLLCGLGVVSLGLGLSHCRVNCQNLSRVGLTFWGAIGAAIFLMPVACHEPVNVLSLPLAQFAAALGLTLALGLGCAGWSWLEGRSRNNEDNQRVLALTPVLSLIFLTVMGLDVRGWEVLGLMMVGLALWISGRPETRPTVELPLPVEFEKQTRMDFEHRKVA